MKMTGRVWVSALAVVAAIAAVAVYATQGDGNEDLVSVEDTEPIVLAGAPKGTVPSVFAHTRESATALLQSSDLAVRIKKQDSCDPEGRPVGTDPATGTPMQPGATVTLLVAHQGPTTDCAGDLTEPLEFVDFATGRGEAPRFAAKVELIVNGEPTRTVSRSQAIQGDWGEPSALDVLNTAVSQVVQVGQEFRPPNLEVSTGTPPDTVCGIARPTSLGDREALNVAISVDSQLRCPVRVSLYRTNGEIDAVAAWTDLPLPTNSITAPVPDVVGMDLTEARDAVTAAGFTSQVERLETCGPRPGVVEQAPTQQDLEDDRADDPYWSEVVTLVIEVPHTTRDCAGLDAAAADFITFAQGGPPPAWAPEVQQLFGYDLRDTITAEQANDPAAWSYCSGVSPSECDLSALVVAGSGEVKTAEYSERYECEMVDYGGLPSGLSPEDHIILFPAILPDCADDWSVELWIDEAGRISAVNLLVSEMFVNED